MLLIVVLFMWMLAACHDLSDKIPTTVTVNGFTPVDDYFDYDPQEAADRYDNPNLTFLNLDPSAHPNDPLWAKALGIIITHYNHIVVPLWARKIADTTYGDDKTKLKELGMLPTPYGYQSDNWTTMRMNNWIFGEINMPIKVPVTLGETLHKKDGGTFTSINCFACHAGVYGNQVIAGAPNKNYNQEWQRRRSIQAGISNFSVAWNENRLFVKSLIRSQFAPLPLDIVDRDGEILADTSRYLTNVVHKIINAESSPVIGAQTATWIVFSTMAHYRPDAITLDDWYSPNEANTPDSVWMKYLDKNKEVWTSTSLRAWWQARYMGLHFWPGATPAGGIQSAGDLMEDQSVPHYGLLREAPVEDRYQVSIAVQSYIAMLESPPYPEPINWEKASKGMLLYTDKCSGCHGLIEPSPLSEKLTTSTTYILHYDQSEGYTLMKDIGTDPTYIWQYQWNRETMDNMLRIPQRYTYKVVNDSPRMDEPAFIYAPPLVSAWATAPYLHNGSVPTLYDLLLPSNKRPKYWRMSENVYAYDYKNMGVSYTTLDRMPGDREQPSDWLVFDTTNTKNGMGNYGHDMDTEKFSDDDRYAIIEFLKVLHTGNTKSDVTVVDRHTLY